MLLSHFGVLAAIAILFNLIIAEFANEFIYDISHWLGPTIILLFGTYILGRAIYKSRHIHSDNCGHVHGKFQETKVENPVTVGLLTGMLPCASSLAVIDIVEKNNLSEQAEKFGKHAINRLNEFSQKYSLTAQ